MFFGHISSFIFFVFFIYLFIYFILFIFFLKRIAQICLSVCANSKNRPYQNDPTHSWSGSYLPLLYTIVSPRPQDEQRRPWSDCADAQSYQGLRCSYMHNAPFMYDAVHYYTFTDANHGFLWAWPGLVRPESRDFPSSSSTPCLPTSDQYGLGRRSRLSTVPSVTGSDLELSHPSAFI